MTFWSTKAAISRKRVKIQKQASLANAKVARDSLARQKWILT